MRFAVFVFLASSAISLAQQAKDKERSSRTVFPQPVTEPAPSPAQAPTPSQASTPSETMEMFFQALKAGQIDSAYDALVKGSIIADRREDVRDLKERTRHALENFGPISGYDGGRKDRRHQSPAPDLPFIERRSPLALAVLFLQV